MLQLTHGFFLVFMQVCICLELQALAIFDDGGSCFNPEVQFSQQCKNSCKISYESTQIGNESTQTEFIPGLSRPMNRPVRTHGEMVQRKMVHESK